MPPPVRAPIIEKAPWALMLLLGSLTALGPMGTAASAVAGFLHDGTARPLSLLILTMILASSAALYGLAKPTTAHAAA